MSKFIQALAFAILAFTVPAFAEETNFKSTLERAKILVEDQRLDEAVKLYTEVLEKQPAHPLALFQMGWISNEKHQFEQAIKYLKPLENTPGCNHKVWNELAFAYRRLGRGDEARKAYESACKSKDDYAPAWLGLGEVLFQLKKDYPAAAQAYEKGLALAPNNAVASYRLGWCLNDAGQSERALPHLIKAVQLEPKYQAAYTDLAFCQLKLSKPKEALDACQKALKLDKNSVLAHYYAGLAYLRLEQKDKLKDHLEALRKLSPERAKKLEAATKPKTT